MAARLTKEQGIANRIVKAEKWVAYYQDKWSEIEHAFMGGEEIDPDYTGKIGREYDLARADLNALLVQAGK